MAKPSANKTRPTEASVEDFFARIENEVRRKDAQALSRLMEEITGEPPVLWGPSIVGFGQSHYKYESGREGDTGAIGFAPRKSSLTIYLVDGTSKYASLLSTLGPHKTGKVCLYIKRLSDVDMDILEELIRSSHAYVTSHNGDMHRAE
jgi:hypothetical protein